MKFFFWLTLALSLTANARVFTENFSSAAQKESSTLVWNFALGYLHPQLKIFGYTDGIIPPASASIVSVGDGSHGSFDPTTYANFGTVVGNHITIDANQFPVLNLTSFHLDSTHTLSSINGPLIIYSLSTVMIDGSILCSGENGLPAVGATGGAGGAGHCGGHAGGAGGNSSASGANGLAGPSTVAGGGIFSNPADSGAGGAGGGGFRNHYGGSGESAGANTGGTSATQLASVDHSFSILDGSGGGGGGSGSSTQGGGGGGGGGGTIIIHAVDNVVISAPSGGIFAAGGAGGSSNTGGAGGSGAGGNVKIFTKGDFQNDTNIFVNSLAPGVPISPTAGDGGQGSRGRTWIRPNAFTGIGGESDDNSLSLGNEGTFNYVTATPEFAVSKSYDTQSSVAIYQSIISNPVSADVTLEIAGSNDNFASDNTGWINSASVATVLRKRYVKFRVSINNSNANNPTRVTDVLLTFEPGIQEDFTFKSGGCGTIKSPPQNLNWLLLLLLSMPLMTAWKLRKTKTVPARAKR